MTTVDVAAADRARRLLRWLLAGAGLGYVVAPLSGGVWPAAACGVLAFVALAGFVVVAPGPEQPKLRRPLIAAALVLAVLTAAEAVWTATTTSDFGWVSYGSGEELQDLLDLAAEQTLQRQRWWATGMLVVTGCVALAVRSLPYQRRPRLAVATGAVSLLLLCLVLADLADVAWGPSAVAVLAAVWLPLLAALVALGVALVAAQRAGAGWFVAAGATLLAVPLLVAVSMTAWTAQLWPIGGRTERPDVMQSISVAETTAVSVAVSSVDPLAAFLAAAMLAGPVLVVVGCLRSIRGSADPAGPAGG